MLSETNSFLSFLNTGFLPSKPPLSRLPADFEAWEELLSDAQQIARPNLDTGVHEKSDNATTWKAWRSRIDTLSVLACDVFQYDECVAQRMHHVLTFLLQFYVSSLPSVTAQQSPTIQLPAPIAVPLVDISRHLGMAPILTYADTVLWNWTLLDPAEAVSTSNVRILDLFTSSPQEAHFFLTSLRMEIAGRPALQAMARAITHQAHLGSVDSQIRYIAALNTITNTLSEISDIFNRVQDGLDASFFYNTFRPFIQGADQGISSPSWSYTGTGLVLQPSGPSAGQSAFMHSFDAFLGVKHPKGLFSPGSGCAYMNAALNPNMAILAEQDSQSICPRARRSTCFSHGSSQLAARPCAPTAIRSGCQTRLQANNQTSFNTRMRAYMPSQHQKCLLWLEAVSPVGQEQTLSYDRSVQLARKRALHSLAAWRDAHIRIVTRYVIVPARREHFLERCSGETLRPSPNGPQVVRGTGGTSLIPLLKSYRDTTRNLTRKDTLSRILIQQESWVQSTISTSIRLDSMQRALQCMKMSFRRHLDWVALTLVFLFYWYCF